MHAAASRTSPTAFARALFAGLPARYDRLAAVLSLGQDRRWRREMIDHVAMTHPGTRPRCGHRPGRRRPRAGRPHRGPDHRHRPERGHAAAAADATWPPPVGRTASASSLGQGERLPFPDATFDALTFTYLLRYVADPAATITELARVVRPGGAMASLEFAVPPNRFWRGWWWLYTRAVLPFAGAALGGRAWFDVGRFLGPNITEHYRRFPVAATVAAWEAAGLTDVGVRRMSLGGGLVMWGRRAADHRDTGSTDA